MKKRETGTQGERVMRASRVFVSESCTSLLGENCRCRGAKQHALC